MENTSPSQGVSSLPIEQILHTLAAGNLEKFEGFFRRMRSAYPRQVGRTCVKYLGTHELDDAGRKMAYWLSAGTDYCTLLIDPATLSADEAKRVAKIMRMNDRRFSVKIIDTFQDDFGVEILSRTLVVLEATGDGAPFIPRLLTLTAHKDERVRSKAVKALCELRPNFGLVKRQLESEDARVRANAVEALWHIPGEEVRHLLSQAEADKHHRVIVNALVGHYYQKDTSALDRLHRLLYHNSELFRAAAIWAIDRLRDRRSIPTLENIVRESSDGVLSEKARRILPDLVPAQPEPEIPAMLEAQELVTLASEVLNQSVEPQTQQRTKEQEMPSGYEAPLFKTF